MMAVAAMRWLSSSLVGVLVLSGIVGGGEGGRLEWRGKVRTLMGMVACVGFERRARIKRDETISDFNSSSPSHAFNDRPRDDMDNENNSETKYKSLLSTLLMIFKIHGQLSKAGAPSHYSLLVG